VDHFKSYTESVNLQTFIIDQTHLKMSSVILERVDRAIQYQEDVYTYDLKKANLENYALRSGLSKD